MKGEAEKKPSSQRQLSMTVRGQTTGEDPEHSHSAALTLHELHARLFTLSLFFISFQRQLKLLKNPNKLMVHQRYSGFRTEDLARPSQLSMYTSTPQLSPLMKKTVLDQYFSA